MTTAQEQLVERVKEAFAHARYNGRTDDDELARAAIAECEAATERTAVSLADKYEAEIKELRDSLNAMQKFYLLKHEATLSDMEDHQERVQ